MLLLSQRETWLQIYSRHCHSAVCSPAAGLFVGLDFLCYHTRKGPGLRASDLGQGRMQVSVLGMAVPAAETGKVGTSRHPHAGGNAEVNIKA